MSSSSNSKRSLTFIVVACRRKSSPSAFQHTHTRTEKEKEKEKEREDRRDGAFVISAMPIPRSLAAKKKRRPPGSVKKTTSSSTPPQREEEGEEEEEEENQRRRQPSSSSPSSSPTSSSRSFSSSSPHATRMNSHEQPQFRPAPGLFGDDDNDLKGGSNKSSAEKKKTKFRLETLDDDEDDEDDDEDKGDGEECEREKLGTKTSTTTTANTHIESDVSSEAKEVPRLKALYNLDSFEDAKQLFQKLSACRALVRGKTMKLFRRSSPTASAIMRCLEKLHPRGTLVIDSVHYRTIYGDEDRWDSLYSYIYGGVYGTMWDPSNQLIEYPTLEICDDCERPYKPRSRGIFVEEKEGGEDVNNFSLVSNRKLNSARGAEYKKLVESNNTSSNDEREEEHSLSDEDCKHMPGYIKATWYKSPNPNCDDLARIPRCVLSCFDIAELPESCREVVLRILKRPTKYSPDSNAPETWHNIKEWKRPFFSFSGNEYDLVRSKSEYAAWILVCGPFHCERITISAHELIDSVPEFDTMEDILDYVENEVPFARVNDQNGETIKVSSDDRFRSFSFCAETFPFKCQLDGAKRKARGAALEFAFRRPKPVFERTDPCAERMRYDGFEPSFLCDLQEMNDSAIDRMKCDCEQGELYEDLLRETERLNLMKRPEPRKLRFPLGACVQCKMSTGWKSGVVVQHWYKPNAVAVRELDLNPRARFPYQIQLDGKNGEEGLIFAPEDVDDCIRRPKTTKAEPRPLLRFNINDLVLVLVRKGVWSSGKIVKHWSLGELEGKAKVNKKGEIFRLKKGSSEQYESQPHVMWDCLWNMYSYEVSLDSEDSVTKSKKWFVCNDLDSEVRLKPSFRNRKNTNSRGVRR